MCSLYLPSAKIVFWLVFEYLKVITYLIKHNFRFRPPAYLTSSRWDEKQYIDLEWPKHTEPLQLQLPNNCQNPVALSLNLAAADDMPFVIQTLNSWNHPRCGILP